MGTVATNQETAMTDRTLSRDINTLVQLLDEQKALTERIEALKAKFKDLGPGEYASADHAVTVTPRERATLNTREVQKILTPAQIAAVTQVSPYVEVRKAY